MIPKIAHFHWEGQPINWLRMMGLYTFARLNPRWEIRLLRTPDHIREKKLATLAMEADWVWYEALQEYGGFAMATDTVFVRPVPDRWLERDMCVCTNGTDNFFHCCFGSIPDTKFLGDCIAACGSTNPKASDYQAMGIVLMKAKAKALGGIFNMGLSVLDTPVGAITPVMWNEVERCWDTDGSLVMDETIGVTWFGGAKCSRSREWDVPEKYEDSAIVKLAIEMTGGL